MRYLKVPGITVRIPLQSIESADFIITTWRDYEKAFISTENRLRAKLERLSDWGTKELTDRRFPITVHFIKIKIVDFWTPESYGVIQCLPAESLDS